MDEYLQKRSQSDKIRVLPKKSQIEKILQKLINEGNNYTDDNRIKEIKFYEGSLVKWEVNGEENTIQVFKKSDSNTWEDVDSIKLEDFDRHYSMYICSCDLLHNDDLVVITSFGLFIWSTWQKDEKLEKFEYSPDFDFLYERKQSYTEKDHRLLLKELPENLLNDYIEDNILMKLYRQELLKFCLKFQHYSLAERLCNKICSETNLMKLCGEDFLKEDSIIRYFNLFSFEELTQYPQLLKKCLSYTLFIHSPSNYEKIKFNKFFSEPHLQSHIKYLQPYFTSNITEKIKQPFILLDSKIKFSTYIKNIAKEIEKIFYKDFQAVILIFPFPKFSSYPATYNFWEELIFPKHSIFSRHQFPELYKYRCGEALLNFKWNTYKKYYYFAIFVFYLSFMLSLHLTFEICQCILFPLNWVTEIWNYFGAILFPVLTSINLLQSSTTPIWAITIFILLLELKFITLFRAIEFGGTYWAMIVGVIKSSLSFFVIIGLIMFAFAHSLHILLRPNISDNLNNSEESNTNIFSLDKLYEIITKIQNDKWDDNIIEMPFIPNSLLRIIGKTELKDKSSKLVIKEEEWLYKKLLGLDNSSDNSPDYGAILFPVLTSINLLQSSTTPIWAITISILLLELKFITFFRAIEFGGTHWAMIIGVIKSSLSFFVIIGLIMFVFAHSLHILLRSNISDNINNSEESNTNMFINLDTAYLAVYMILTGDSSSVSNCFDKIYEIITKIQNDKWDDDIIEMPFIPNSLLKIIGKTELKVKEEEWPYLSI
ncbi:hypothetical protein C2G38_2217431 [Gigaspora rosea]|uniref:Ion transport domain-containing protein n=1 Tax=Gigaspora rosea TaxID=44941 RepID=A0A397UC28_9GLOM|nr:hypothetical protein C2G38_2217431 [Gigaspora rosea]